MFHKEGKRRLK